jgi:hypothetical protein
MVSVYAVNAVGRGQASTASGTAWARSATHLCNDILSGDYAVENFCHDAGSTLAWHDLGLSGIQWISAQAGNPRPAGTWEYLCTTYYTGAVSGTMYALVTTPTQQACTQALPGFQPPDTPHVVAYVSATRVDASSRQICEYVGQTTGANSPPTFTSHELSPCGTVPPGLSGNPPIAFRFWT